MTDDAEDSPFPPINYTPGHQSDLNPVPNIDCSDGGGMPHFPGELRNVAELYVAQEPGPGSSGAEYYEPVDMEDSIAPLPRASAHIRHPPRTKIVSEGIPYNEDWSRYVVEHSRKFTFGTVFKTMWSEPMGNSRLSKHNKDPVGVGTSISEFGLRDYNGIILYEGIRRFIVVDGNDNGARDGNSICIPIATYKKQACTKHGVKPQHHGIIHTSDKHPMLLNNEPELGVAPIRLVINRDLVATERLGLESRVNYSKHVTIEHNSNVHIIGRIHPDDLEILELGVDGQWEKRVRCRKKDKKLERSRR